MIYGHRQLFQFIGGTPRVIVTIMRLGPPPTVMIESFDWQSKHFVCLALGVEQSLSITYMYFPVDVCS